VSVKPLLIEIGCEEIPARMIPAAASELGRRLEQILDRSGLSHGPVTAWGGSRRLAVRVEDVQGRQRDREQTVLGPPASVAFDAEGQPTPAALGFAKRQGVSAEALATIESKKGSYVGISTRVPGRSVGEVLGETLPDAVRGMPFPKTMRWADGVHRWVRPVHWVVALAGDEVLPLRLFGVAAGNRSAGHRFLGPAAVDLQGVDAYVDALEAAYVVVDPARRRERLTAALQRGARQIGGLLVEDPLLLEEVVDLVEWPGVVAGSFDRKFLDLPRELLVTTLRHHQKCFSVQSDDGALLPAFLAVTNTAGDASGHIRRGNEWVVGGRLEDARFFWNEDRESSLESRLPQLEGVVFHARCGSYADKRKRLEELAAKIATAIGLEGETIDSIRQAARFAKADLVTSLVGEFPELQGIVGGLLLEQEGAGPEIVRAVYEHYRPAGRTDAMPGSRSAGVVALADKLDSAAELIAAGERPTGSRDPLGLRRAANGIFRIVIEGKIPLSLDALAARALRSEGLIEFLHERLVGYLRDCGYSSHEIRAAIRPRVDELEFRGWPLDDLVARLEAVTQVRGRRDFRHLVKLTERVDNILAKNAEKFVELAAHAEATPFEEPQTAARELGALLARCEPLASEESGSRHYGSIITILSEFIEPVDRFFQDVLVIDPNKPEATLHRRDLLARLKDVLTRYFDIRELAGQADRRTS
jgi:glycyl-tRNA synthetase beta chain